MNFADHITAADNEPLRVVKPRTRSSQKYTLTEQMKHQMNSVSSRTIAEDDTAVVIGGGAGGRAAESILRQLSQAPSQRTKVEHVASPSVQAKLDDANALSEAHHYAAAKSVLHGVLLDAAADSGELSALDEKDVVLALAQCLHMEGDDAAWIEMLCHAAALETSDSALELKIADAVFDELQYEAALVHFDAALTQLRAVAPAAAMASMGARRLSKMALCAFQMNDPIRAKGLCRQAIALESENAVAKKLLKKIVARQQRSRLALNAALTPPSQQPLRLNERNGSLSSQQQPAPPGRRREGGAATLASLGSRQRLILQPGQRLSMGGGGGLGGSGTPRGGAEAAQPCKHCSASLAETLTLTKKIRKMEERASKAEKKKRGEINLGETNPSMALLDLAAARTLLGITDEGYVDLHEALAEAADATTEGLTRDVFLETAIAHTIGPDASVSDHGSAYTVLCAIYDHFEAFAESTDPTAEPGSHTFVDAEDIAVGFQAIVQHGDVDETVEMLFEVFDYDNDGFIEEPEVEAFMKSSELFRNALRVGTDQLPYSEVWTAAKSRALEMLAACNSTIDRTIDKDEFKSYFERLHAAEKEAAAAAEEAALVVALDLPTARGADEATGVQATTEITAEEEPAAAPAEGEEIAEVKTATTVRRRRRRRTPAVDSVGEVNAEVTTAAIGDRVGGGERQTLLAST